MTRASVRPVVVVATALCFGIVLALPRWIAAAFAQTQSPPAFAYVVSDGATSPQREGPKVSAIDLRTDTVDGEAVTVGSLQDEPTGYVAISPGGRYVYVGIGRFVLGTPSGYDDHRIAVVDTTSRELVRSIPVSGSMPAGTGGMALTPDGGTLYAYKGHDPTLATHVIAVMSLPSGELRALVPLPFGSSGRVIAVSPDGNTVVAAAVTGVAFIDRETNTVSANLQLAGAVAAIAFSPDSATMYALTNGTDGKLFRIDVRNRVVRDSLALEAFPRALAVSPDGRRVYATVDVTRGRLLVVNTGLWQIAAQVPIGAYPDGVALTPSGDKAYVTLSGKAVVVVSTESNAVAKTMDTLGWVSHRGTNFVGPTSAAITASVEYFHKGFGHYFTTNGALEIDKLDAGELAGWSRTGERFDVDIAPSPGTASVCRFFSSAFAGKSSHFLAPRGFGCEGALANADWLYEGDVHYVGLPDANGACPAGRAPLYRVYNNGQGGAPNHRLTVKRSVRDAMLATGWIAEGAGIGVGMCALAQQ